MGNVFPKAIRSLPEADIPLKDITTCSSQAKVYTKWGSNQVSCCIAIVYTREVYLVLIVSEHVEPCISRAINMLQANSIFEVKWRAF